MAIGSKIKSFYEEKYKILMFIPFLMVLLAFAQIGYQYHSTGDFVNRGVTLKGGSLISFVAPQGSDIASIQSSLTSSFPGHEIAVRTLGPASNPTGIVVESEYQTEAEIIKLKAELTRLTNVPTKEMGTEIIGSAIGASFFKQSLVALGVAFLLMGCVVFAYFRTPVPSLAVILAGASNLIVTLAIFNLTGEKLSTAGIAAFLMLLGYSVDTDILLTSRVLKRKEGTVMHRIHGAISTGMSMTAATLGAVIVALIFVHSDVIHQIMLVLFIGLLTDMFMTWIQNVGILRLYVEKGERK